MMNQQNNLKSWLDQGPFTVSLTSGFFGFFTHVGFVKALFDAGYEPQGYRGCSAGSIVSASLASGLSIEQIEQTILAVDRNDFWDPRPGLGLLKGRKFFSLVQKQTESNFSNLQKPLTISVFDIFSLKTKAINMGAVPEAVWASCAVPMMFHPVRIQKRFFWDGGILDPLAIHGIDRQERILIHDITDQTQWGFKQKISHLQNAQLIRLNDIPKCGPRKLHLGKEIIANAYEKTMSLISL